MKTIRHTTITKHETRRLHQLREASFARSLSDRELRNVFMNTTRPKDPIRWGALRSEMDLREETRRNKKAWE